MAAGTLKPPPTRKELTEKLRRDHTRLRRAVAALGKDMSLEPWMYGEGPTTHRNRPGAMTKEEAARHMQKLLQNGPATQLTDAAVKPAWVGTQAGRYAMMLEAHYRYYLSRGQIDRATAILTSLFKASVLVATRHWQMQRRIPDSDDATATDEIDLSGMSDDELLAGMKENEAEPDSGS